MIHRGIQTVIGEPMFHGLTINIIVTVAVIVVTITTLGTQSDIPAAYQEPGMEG